MINFEQVKQEIIYKLSDDKYSGDLSDIGNDIDI